MQGYEKEIFELLPFKTHDTKLRIQKIIRDEQTDPYAVDEDGCSLLQGALFYDRYDIVEMLVEKQKKLYDGSDHDREWYEIFREAVKSGRRNLIGMMMSRGILKCVPDDEKTVLYADIASFKDTFYVECIVKEEGVLDASVVPEINNYMDRKFVQLILNKYIRRLEMSSEQDGARMIKLAVICDDTRLAAKILRRQKYKCGFCYLAGGSDKMFELLLKKSGKIEMKDRPEILTYTYMGSDGEARLERLIRKRSWKLTFRDDKGKDVCDIMENKIETIHYPNNRKGYLVRQEYKKKLQKLHVKLEMTRAL